MEMEKENMNIRSSRTYPALVSGTHEMEKSFIAKRILSLLSQLRGIFPAPTHPLARLTR